MILPPVTAEVSLYKSRGHYRSSWSAGSTSGIVPSWTARNIYVSETACDLAGTVGQLFGGWTLWVCSPRFFPDDPDPWYQLYTNP